MNANLSSTASIQSNNRAINAQNMYINGAGAMGRRTTNGLNSKFQDENNNNFLWTTNLQNPVADLNTKVVAMNRFDSGSLGSTVLSYGNNQQPPQSAAAAMRSGSVGGARMGRGG
jgi:hypothetical protein